MKRTLKKVKVQFRVTFLKKRRHQTNAKNLKKSVYTMKFLRIRHFFMTNVNHYLVQSKSDKNSTESAFRVTFYVHFVISLFLKTNYAFLLKYKENK